MELTRDELSKKISKLIQSKKEGKTWDFKEKWYKNKKDWVVTILAMANNCTSEDSYIIIGVKDQSCFPSDGPNWRNSAFKQTSELNDWLRKIPFDSFNYPDLELETKVEVRAKVDGTERYYSLDVIVVKSTANVPYYLSRDVPSKKTVKEKEIYVRMKDQNVLATPPELEELYKKRFGLSLSIMDRFKLLLSKKDEWDCILRKWKNFSPLFQNTLDSDDSDVLISALYPEFTIKVRQSNDFPDNKVLDIRSLPPYIFKDSDFIAKSDDLLVGEKIFEGKNKICTVCDSIDGRRTVDEEYCYLEPSHGRGFVECLVGKECISRLNYCTLSESNGFWRIVVQPNCHDFGPLFKGSQCLRTPALASVFYFIKSNDFCYKVFKLLQHHYGSSVDYDEFVKPHTIYFEDEKEKEEFFSHCKKAWLMDKAEVYYNRKDYYYNSKTTAHTFRRQWLSDNLKNLSQECGGRLAEDLGIAEVLKNEEAKEAYIKGYIYNKYFVKCFERWKNFRKKFSEMLSNEQDWEVTFKKEDFLHKGICRPKDSNTNFVSLYSHKDNLYFFAIREYEILGFNALSLFYFPSENEFLYLDRSFYKCELFVKDHVWCLYKYSCGFGGIVERLSKEYRPDPHCFFINPLETKFEFDRIFYLYFFKDSIEFKINDILLHTALTSSETSDIIKEWLKKCDQVFKNVVIYFENEEEKQEFDRYLKTRLNDVLKEINDFLKENWQKFEQNCRERVLKICSSFPFGIDSDVETMVERGTRAEKIAEIFRDWKAKKSSQ